jgi:hypothetical protein
VLSTRHEAHADHRTTHTHTQVLQDLALPHYHHELVKAAVEQLFEHPEKAPALRGLLRQLSDTGVITSTQMAQVRVLCGALRCARRQGAQAGKHVRVHTHTT